MLAFAVHQLLQHQPLAVRRFASGRRIRHALKVGWQAAVSVCIDLSLRKIKTHSHKGYNSKEMHSVSLCSVLVRLTHNVLANTTQHTQAADPQATAKKLITLLTPNSSRKSDPGKQSLGQNGAGMQEGVYEDEGEHSSSTYDSEDEDQDAVRATPLQSPLQQQGSNSHQGLTKHLSLQLPKMDASSPVTGSNK